MNKYVCVHAHFYQPPRENPWLESIDRQESAHPYHDWNERVANEAYAPNAWARILDQEKRISRIVSNYARISFNFGPTLLQWLEQRRPDVYHRILQADIASRRRFSGHGSAMAQVYSHLIMPLANRRDKKTQVIWGVRDFKHRFGRKPEGMWLPETAVDLQSLEALAEEGILFTVLSPHQASAFRTGPRKSWQECGSAGIDTNTPYSVRLPSGKQICLFFYNGPIAKAVAFEGLLHQGDYLVSRLLSAFGPRQDGPQLVHYATDGETYGHHHKHGEMALAYALDRIEAEKKAVLTNYGEFLARCGPMQEVRIVENTSWSCSHGVERWHSDCGCRTGSDPSYNQAWRAPLRDALDWLRDAIAPQFEKHAEVILRDPWEARDDYISVVLDRSPENVEEYLARHARQTPDDRSASTALKLLEMQRQAMLMYTSCGWFFEDLAGIETFQILRHAGRALELAADLFGDGLEKEFHRRLEKARSNRAEKGTGGEIFAAAVRDSRVGLDAIGAHYAVSALFRENQEHSRVFCYSVEREDHRKFEEGKARLFIGRATVKSDITWESRKIEYGVLHLGDHNVSGGIRGHQSEADYGKVAGELAAVFRRGELPATVRAVERFFDGGESALRALMPEEQDRVLSQVLQGALLDAEAAYRRVCEEHALLIRFVASMGKTLPRTIGMAAECILQLDLVRACSEPEPDRAHIVDLMQQADLAHIRMELSAAEEALRRKMDQHGKAWSEKPESVPRLRQFLASVDLAATPPFKAEFWQAQNCYSEAQAAVTGSMHQKARTGDKRAAEWVRLHKSLGRRLNFHIDD